MSRLYDHLMSDVIAPPLPNVESWIDPRTSIMTCANGTQIDLNASTKTMRHLVRGAEVIDASNVAQSFADRIGDPDAFSSLMKDIRCLIPPFQKFFIEWEWAAWANMRRTGVLVQAFRSAEALRDAVRTLFEDDSVPPKEMKIEVDDVLGDWFLLCFDFVQFGTQGHVIGGLRGPFNAWFVALDEQGAPLAFSHKRLTRLIPAAEVDAIGGTDFVAFLALSIMNCDNIETEVVEAPAKLNKKRKKRGKRPLVSYRTIRVNPNVGPRAPSSNASKGEGKNRRHKRRGHVKDYRKGKGLFGKYKGLWYWGPALCGSSSEGVVVVSDYSVETE